MEKKLETFSTIVDESGFIIEVVSDTIITIQDNEFGGRDASLEVNPKSVTLSIGDTKVDIGYLLQIEDAKEKIVNSTLDELLARDILTDYDEE